MDSQMTMRCNSNVIMFGFGYMESQNSQERHNNRSIPEKDTARDTYMCVTRGVVWIPR